MSPVFCSSLDLLQRSQFARCGLFFGLWITLHSAVGFAVSGSLCVSWTARLAHSVTYSSVSFNRLWTCCPPSSFSLLALNPCSLCLCLASPIWPLLTETTSLLEEFQKAGLKIAITDSTDLNGSLVDFWSTFWSHLKTQRLAFRRLVISITPVCKFNLPRLGCTRCCVSTNMKLLKNKINLNWVS